MDIEKVEEKIEMIKFVLEMHSTDKILRKTKIMQNISIKF